jgi:hypothetical protein
MCFFILGEKMKDLTGRRFGRLVVLKFLEARKRAYYWQVICDCGNQKVVRGGNLIKGSTRSCGCLQKEILNKRCFKHGISKTKFYRIWVRIKDRCLGKKCKNFKHYGGRGIKICKEWLDFENFKRDMYDSYLKHIKEFRREQTSIDRIDNDGNYEKKNCRWATRVEQSNNRRNNRILEFMGGIENYYSMG